MTVTPCLPMLRAALVGVAVVSAAAMGATAAAPPTEDPLAPMAFLAGHCWRGTFADGKRTDEHCFQWMYGRNALRDVHTVRAPGTPDYVGETTYYWDSAAKRIEYLYVENGGGIMRGTVMPSTRALEFPATTYVAGGEAMTLRVRWTLLDEASYEAWSEAARGPGEWATMFKVRMAKVS